jgi:hypothetical protein
LISRSLDGGSTWTSAAALHTSATKDRKKGSTIETDASVRLGYDGVDRWIAVWTSWLAFEGDTEYDADTVFATSRDDCPSTPSISCRVPAASQTTLRVLDGDGGRDKITWTWKGEETLLADFGDPLSTSDYTLCLYDHVSSSPVLVSEHDMPAGESCKGKPCWKAASSGLLYKDPRLEHGPIKAVKLVPGADGKAKIKVKAKGPTVAPPRLPLAVSPEVTAQLHNLETGECWSATYTSAITNDAVELKAKSN